MKEELPPSSGPTPSGSSASGATSTMPAGTSSPKRRPWLLYGCGLFLVLCLLVIATVALTIWYIQRPIKPVVLSPAEKAAVEEKLQHLDDGARTATAEGRIVRPQSPQSPSQPMPSPQSARPTEPDRI